ncbi:MAG: DUF1572 family protein [Flavobacteriales bacterium]|nr:DUF1572 family protein [Flavobacteriales bacterium]
MPSVSDHLRSSSIKHLNEGRERLHKCLGLLSEDQVWKRANTSTASVGNLVLHLCGNVGQWINSTLGSDADQRVRDAEFSDTGSRTSRSSLQNSMRR